MNMEPLPPGCLDQLQALSSCLVASAIETFGVRLRNEGFSDDKLHCTLQDLPPTVGYAATARIRSSDPPMEGHGYYDRSDWWDSLLKIPAPRVVVIEDLDTSPGLGAFVGVVHANILRALGCVGLVTNGAVRDLPEVRQAGFQMFAGNISVSHAYAHVFDFGGTIEIAERVPAKALEILELRNDLTAFCHSSEFSLKNLHRKVQELKS